MFNKLVISLAFVLSTITIHVVADINHANALAKNGHYKEALPHLTSAIQADPKNARAYKLRGHVYYAMGNYAKALLDLDQVVALVPNSANAFVDRAIIYSVSGRHGSALADIEQALSIKPNSTFAQAVRREILERAK